MKAVPQREETAMILRTCLFLAILSQLSACIATPRFEISERIDFNAMQPDQKPMSYSDLLCCYDCTA